MVKKDTIDDLKKRIKELEENEQYYKLIADHSTDMISRHDSDGVYIYASPSCLRLIGYTADELVGQNAYDFIYSDDLEKIRDSHLQIIETDTIEMTSYRIRHKEGHYVWVETASKVIKNSNTGEIEEIIATTRDITERKHAEEVLESQNRLMNTLLDNLQVGVFMVEAPTGRPLLANRCAKDLLGRGIMNGADKTTIAEIYQAYKEGTEEIYPKDEMPIVRGLRGDNCSVSDMVVVQPSGKRILLEVFGSPVNDSQGNVIASLVSFSDITERKHAEKELRESEKRLRQISDTTFEAIVFHDHGIIIHANDQYYKMFGYTKEELRGINAISLTVSQGSIQKMKNMISSDSLEPYEVTGIRKNGERFPIEVHAKISEYHGRKIRMAAIRDITRYKQAEEDTRKALEYAAEQGRHALIGEVAGNMAHDFNNVLMGIMGNAQLALLSCDDENTKKRLESICEFSERGKDITNNLISFSKDQEPKQAYFKIEDKIELVLKMLEKDLAGIEVSRNYEKGIPELLADPGMIQDVLTNLMQNSIHAMSKVKHPALSLKAYSRNSKVYFEVKDNGCGIPKEHQDSIYTPSFTLKGSRDETGSYKLGVKGTGYGMSNVKKYIVEKHKGDISLESEVGKGTKITIALKIIKRQLSSDEKKEVVKSKIYSQRRILLVEDENAIAGVQYQLLTQEPFNHIVLVAVNGRAAIDTFDGNEFDAVSLDYMLPGDINGIDVYNHIRENDNDIPVLFISGNVDFIASMNKLKERDPNLDHLSKPVNNLDYVNKINEIIGKSIK